MSRSEGSRHRHWSTPGPHERRFFHGALRMEERGAIAHGNEPILTTKRGWDGDLTHDRTAARGLDIMDGGH